MWAMAGKEFVPKWAKEMMKDLKKMIEEERKSRKELSKQFGKFTEKFGYYVEDMAFPGVKKFVSTLMDIKEADIRKELLDGRYEVDGLFYGRWKKNGRVSVVVLFVRSSVGARDVREAVRQVQELKKVYRPEIDYDMYLAVAGLSVPRNIRIFASRRGIYIFVPSGEVVECVNPHIKPRRF